MRTCFIFVSLVLASGCGSSSSSNGSSGSGGATGSGGVGGDASSNTGAQAFIGTWARSGTIVLTCAGQQTTTPITGDLVITAGPASDTIVGTQPNGCVANYTVAANVASETVGEICDFTGDAGVETKSTIESHTLTLGANGQTITEASQASVVKTVAGKSTNCTAKSSGTFTKQ